MPEQTLANVYQVLKSFHARMLEVEEGNQAVGDGDDFDNFADVVEMLRITHDHVNGLIDSGVISPYGYWKDDEP